MAAARLSSWALSKPSISESVHLAWTRTTFRLKRFAKSSPKIPMVEVLSRRFQKLDGGSDGHRCSDYRPQSLQTCILFLLCYLLCLKGFSNRSRITKQTSKESASGNTALQSLSRSGESTFTWLTKQSYMHESVCTEDPEGMARIQDLDA